MNGTVGRAAGIGVGLLVVLVGLSLFTPEAGLPQTPAIVALASVLVALGIGAIGAAIMPGTLTINGNDVTPLKLSGTATGGAAFFVATLIFLYATGANKPGGEAAPTPTPMASPTVAAPSGPPVTPTSAPTSVSNSVSAPNDHATAAPVNGDAGGDDGGDHGAMSPSVSAQSQIGIPARQQLFRVRTYCSSCCPQGPQNCRNTGVGVALTLQQAASIAVQYCIASGGEAATCYANVEQF